MHEQILGKLPYYEVDGFSLWRLGVYEGRSFELVVLPAGTVQPAHYHENSDAKLRFIFGKGRIILNSIGYEYSEGSIFEVPRMMTHGFNSEEDSLFLVEQNPPIRNQETELEDIVFVDDN